MSENEIAGLSPIFITGAWRSGTTLISRILNNHHELSVTYDTVHFLRFAYGKYDPITNKVNIKRLVHDIGERLKLRYNFDIDEDMILQELGDGITYASVYDSVMRDFLLKNTGSKIWGEKTNLAWTKIPKFLEMFPNGTVIHVIRDPRAVLASWKKFTNAPGNDYLDSIMNCYDSMRFAQKYETRYAHSNYVMLRYEDLVSNTQETVESLCEKIGVEFDAGMLDVNKFTDRAGDKWKANTVYNVEINGISMEMIDKWKNKLEEWEVFLTEELIGALLDTYHYQSLGLVDSRAFADKAISEVQKSSLVSEGLIRYLVTKESFERYPSDPSDERNWGTIFNRNTKE